MTKTFAQVTAFALAAAVTTVTVAGTSALAAQQYARADAIVAQNQAASSVQQVAQRVVIVGHRAA